MTETRIPVYDGKYTFVVPDGDWRVHILRYDEPWVIIEKGHKAVLALMDELLHDREHFANTNALMAAAICAAPEAECRHGCIGVHCPADRPGTCSACRFNDLRTRLRGLAEGQVATVDAPARGVLMTCSRCTVDGNYATCVGAYHDEPEGPSCDACCGHDTSAGGYCWPLQQATYVRALKETP